jgi:hypothetical protein
MVRGQGLSLPKGPVSSLRGRSPKQSSLFNGLWIASGYALAMTVKGTTENA